MFMVFYYRVFGLFAISALALNLVLLVAILSLPQATLTMPGIVGIVLHMGIGGRRQRADLRAHPRRNTRCCRIRRSSSATSAPS